MRIQSFILEARGGSAIHLLEDFLKVNRKHTLHTILLSYRFKHIQCQQNLSLI